MQELIHCGMLGRDLPTARVRGVMADIENDILAFKDQQADLEANHLGKWVVIHERELVGIYDQFEVAAGDAVAKYGRGPYLIRQIGAPPVSLPASAMFILQHA